MAMAVRLSEFKVPPFLNKDIPYATWKELKIWEAFTSIEKTERAPAIFLTLTGQAREAVLEPDIEKDLAIDDGLKNLTKAIGALYLKNESCLAYEAYKAYIYDHWHFMIHFERLYNKAKNYKMEIQDGAVAYQLLNIANLSDSNNQLITATLTEMKYSLMKDQLNKVFASTYFSVQPKAESSVEFPPVKIEPIDASYVNNVPNAQKPSGHGFTSTPHDTFTNNKDFTEILSETYYGSFRGRGRSARDLQLGIVSKSDTRQTKSCQFLW